MPSKLFKITLNYTDGISLVCEGSYKWVGHQLHQSFGGEQPADLAVFVDDIMR